MNCRIQIFENNLMMKFQRYNDQLKEQNFILQRLLISLSKTDVLGIAMLNLSNEFKTPGMVHNLLLGKTQSQENFVWNTTFLKLPI